MAPRQRDKVIRTFTLRQTWPRNMGSTALRPRWQAIGTFSPFPSNILYGRPRSIDRTDSVGTATPPPGLITVEPAIAHGGVSLDAAIATYGPDVVPEPPEEP